MKLISVLPVGALTLVLSVTGLAQHKHGQAAQQENKMGKPGDMMGKPTAEQTVDGVRVQLWMMTQVEHKKMMQERMKSDMGGMKHDTMGAAKDTATMGHDMDGGMKGMDHGTMEKDTMAHGKGADRSKMMEMMMAGTHHIMVKLRDQKPDEADGDGHIMVAVTAPSGKKSTVHLSGMMDHFGGGVSLDEKGSFRLDLSIKAGSKTRKAKFEYVVE